MFRGKIKIPEDIDLFIKFEFSTLVSDTFHVRILVRTFHLVEAAVAQLVEALHYKPDGRGFDSRCCRNFSLT
jgi:hypothetical protein